MSGFWGGVPASMRTYGAQLTQGAEGIEALYDKLAQKVLREAFWSGADGASFRARFEFTVAPLMSEVASRLKDLGLDIGSHAEEQDLASASDLVLPANSVSWEDLAGFSGKAALSMIPPVSPAVERGVEVGTEQGKRELDGREAPDAKKGAGEADLENPNAEFATPGPPGTPYGESGLGKGVPGTEADAPLPPEWIPPPDGAGEHGSEDADLSDHAGHAGARAGADVFGPAWPDAADNLDHFLDNTGEDKFLDVDRLMGDQPSVAREIEEIRHQAGVDAVEKAKSEGVTSPITYPLSTPWESRYVEGQGNWFFATNGFSHNQTGTVTVYPPTPGNPEWKYETTTQVNFRDRYNWDGGKAVEILGQTVTDEQLAELHRAGIAQEYNLVGQSTQNSVEGSAP